MRTEQNPQREAIAAKLYDLANHSGLAESYADAPELRYELAAHYSVRQR